MSVRTPNDEQMRAIKHSGGVLLSAGAGSGKTFVLVEHLIYRFQELKPETYESEEWRVNIRDNFSKTVVMTFTNKAASEIKIRLLDRIGIEIDEAQEFEKVFWQEIRDSLSHLNLGTIHGFCLKVLKSGAIPLMKTDLTLLSEYEIESLIDREIDIYFDSVEDTKSLVIPLFRLQKRSLKQAYLKIFSDAGLRAKWDDSLKDALSTNSSDEIFAKCLDIFDFSLEELVEFNPGKKIAKWEEFFVSFTSKRETLAFNKIASAEVWLGFFSEFKRFPSPSKNASDEIKELFKRIKAYRDFLKENLQEFKLYNENFDFIHGNWSTCMKEIYQQISRSYEQLRGISFTDMEYEIARALEDENILDKISENYRYFLVDEFQDTSEIQFDIIEKIIQGDYSKLFCIGDLKQAIYGFRGGEVSVFKHCESHIPLSISLKNNYRSLPSVINFNNLFFDKIFATGDSFRVSAQLPFDPAPQDVPLDYQENGEIVLGKVSRETYTNFFQDEKLKLGPEDINQLEAKFISSVIEKNQDSFETQCVLYKKLAPSTYLLKEFLDKDLSFRFQVKVSLQDDPIIFTFLTLITKQDFSESLRAVETMLIDETLNYLGISTHNLENKIKSFYTDIESLPLIDSFTLFLLKLNLSTIYISESINLIEQLYRASNFNIEDLYLLIKEKSEKNYSIDFSKGTSSKAIQVMTVHASKGLEFDRVYLGGIWTNGRSMVKAGPVGKTPNAFKWKLDLYSKESFKSPELILENLIEKKEDFQEDKRLLYVANTRAKKSLYLINFELGEKEFTLSDKAWWSGFDQFLVACDKYTRFEELSIDGDVTVSQGQKRPFFNSNTTGFAQRDKALENIKILGEMSVTNFSEIALCPRKFYLRNILKLDQKDLDFIELESKPVVKKTEATTQIKSSAERGTEIHDLISNMIKRNFVIPLSVIGSKEEDIFHWVKSEIYKKKPTKLVSEEDIKFPVFGHMFNGKPDLILWTASTVEVWDFKTGALKDQAPQYELQLYMYAYSLYELGFITTDQKVVLQLVYVDEKNIQTTEIGFLELRQKLKDFWEKTNEINSVNRDHCGSCLFGKLCRFQEEMTHA